MAEKEIIARKEGNLELSMFDNRHSYMGLTPSGEPYIRRRQGPWDNPTRMTVDRMKSSQLVLPVEVSQKPFHLPLGLTVITGRTEVGKSSFARALERSMPTRRVLAVEPPDGGEELGRLANDIFFDADGAMLSLAASMVAELKEHGQIRTLPILDSLRAPVFETTGSAGERGMIMAFFTALTRVSNSLALNGLTVLATVNPLQSEDKAEDAFIQRAKSALPSVIVLTSSKVGGAVDEFTGSITSRPNRQSRTFTWSTAKATAKKEKLKTIGLDFPMGGGTTEPLSAAQRHALANLNQERN